MLNNNCVATLKAVLRRSISLRSNGSRFSFRYYVCTESELRFTLDYKGVRTAYYDDNYYAEMRAARGIKYAEPVNDNYTEWLDDYSDF